MHDCGPATSLEITETALLLAKNGAAFVRDFELGAEITAKGNALADLIASIRDGLANKGFASLIRGTQTGAPRPTLLSIGKASLYIPQCRVELCSRCVGCVVSLPMMMMQR